MWFPHSRPRRRGRRLQSRQFCAPGSSEPTVLPYALQALPSADNCVSGPKFFNPLALTMEDEAAPRALERASFSAQHQRQRDVVFTPSGGPQSLPRRSALTGTLRPCNTRRTQRSWQKRRVRESNALFWASWPKQAAAANGPPRAMAREHAPQQPRPISVQDAVSAPDLGVKPQQRESRPTLQRPQHVDPRQRVLARTRRFRTLRARTKAAWHNKGVEEANPYLLHSCPECDGSCLEISEHLLGCLICDAVALRTSRLLNEPAHGVTGHTTFWHQQPQLRMGHPSWAGRGSLCAPHVTTNSTSPAWKEDASFGAKVSGGPSSQSDRPTQHPCPPPRCTGLPSNCEVQENHIMHDQVTDETSLEAAQAAQASGTKTLPSNYPARRRRTRASRAPIPQLTHVATVLRQASADEPRLQEAAVELAEWVDSSELPEESLEHQLAWQILEHCAGTPGPLDLHTSAFADIANQAQVVGPAQPLVLAVANITHWRPEILRWYQHTGADCLLAQETHLNQAQEAKAKATLVEVGLHSFWAGATATNSTKGGLVVATPWQAHPRLIQSFTVNGCGFIAVELPRVQWRLALVTVYLQTATGLQAEPNATILATLLALLQRLPNWVAAGDWNVDLQQFAATNIPVVARGEVIGSPAAALPSGNTLDYVLASRSVAGLVNLQVDKAVPFGPHYCLRLELDLAHGLLNLPALKGFSGPQGAFPAPLAPTLPSASHAEGREIEDTSLDCGHDPVTLPGTGCDLEPWNPAITFSAVNIGGATWPLRGTTKDFADFSKEVETTLFGKAQGRGVANPVTYRPLLRDDRHASRWHGEPHAVLSQVARLIDIGMESNQEDPDLWHLAHRFLSSDMPGEHLPDWAIILGFEDFQPPAQLPHLSNEQWLRAKDSVKQEITLCRLEVSRRSRDCYAEWLRTSSTGSLKPLFKCIRKYEASVERPFATFSAASKLFLRAQQWTQLWHSTGTPPSQRFEELKQRARSQARELQPLDAITVERYIRKTPLKASGPDGWTPQMARALTSEQCDHLATLFRRAELTGEFPQQWSATLVILLAKNPEVERPIALMHTMLKCWMKLRWALLSAWQDTFSAQAWWDSCGPGLSCLDVAVRRLIQYECSQSVTEHRITLYLDLSCFYETISHDRLTAHADKVSFPPLLLWGALCAYRGPRFLFADGLIAPPAFARRGVLAGCPIAVALSKVALWPACNKVLNQPAVATADTWVDDLSVDFCGKNPHQVAAKGLRVARALFASLAEEGLEVSLKKTTWVASSAAVEAALKKQSKDNPVQVSTVAKDLGVANAAGRARRTQTQAKRLRKGAARGQKLHSLRVLRTSHRVRISKMGSLSAAIWGHQGLGLSPKQLRGPRTQAALAGRKQKLGSADVVFSIGEGNCCDPLRTVVLQHWRTLHRLFFAQGFPDKYLRLWQITWGKLLRAPKRWALVKGPIAAMIAYLQDHKVDASDPRLWRFPKGSLQGQGLWRFTGDTVSLQPSLSMEHQVEEALHRLLQSAANHRIAAQDAGAGASQGIDWTVPRRLLRAKTSRPNLILSLRAVWQGAFYTTTKGAKRQCPLCRCDADLRHVLLDCKWWQGRGSTIPPHWAKLSQKWPSDTLWVRGLPPAEYSTAPPLSPSALELKRTGVWSGNQSIDGDGLVFGTDATGTTNDPRTRIVAVAVVACSLHNGVLKEVGSLSQVLPLGCSVVQGEAYALALLLRNTTGVVATTADCKPAIAQASHPHFRAAHANIWEEVWHVRHRLHITWHPSHRPTAEYVKLYGDSHHWKVKLNELADQACKAAAAQVQWREHQARVAQLDELAEEVSRFLASRAWILLAGDEAPPLDLKPRQLRRGTLPPKPKTKQPTEAKKPQQHNRPAPQGGLNKKQRLELLLASEHVHGHRYAWTHSNPTNHSLKCSVCSLFIQQVHPEEVFTRLEAQHCAHRPLQDISRFGLHPTHSFYNMGAVLLCTKCFAVHKPGQLALTKVVQEPCPGASRAHEKRRSLWAQKYLEETTAPGTLFGAGIPKQQKAPLLGPSAQQVEAQPPSAVPTADGHTGRTPVGCGPHASPDAKKAAGASTTRTPQPVPQLPKASNFFKGPTLPASVTPTLPAGLGSKQGSQLEHLSSTRSHHREPNLLQARTPARPNSELFPQGKQSSTPTSSRPQVGGRREEGASPSIASYFQPCHGRGSGSSIAGSTPGRGGGYGNKRKGPAPPPTPSPSQTGSGAAQTEAQEERKTPPPKGGRTGVAGRTAGKKAGRTTSTSPAKLAGTPQAVPKKTPAQPKTGQRPQSQ